VAEAASVQGQDGVPVRNGLGDPRAKPRRPEVVPVHVGVTPEATAGSARDDVAAKLRELIFKGLRMDVARHVPRLARRLGERSRMHPELSGRTRGQILAVASARPVVGQ
jgi:hypothetical protein